MSHQVDMQSRIQTIQVASALSLLFISPVEADGELISGKYLFFPDISININWLLNILTGYSCLLF